VKVQAELLDHSEEMTLRAYTQTIVGLIKTPSMKLEAKPIIPSSDMIQESTNVSMI
jgi:hypothetical protein